ncbi:glycerol kinase [bacterium B17]|nr:glycerol kinase [bacterium B17]
MSGKYLLAIDQGTTSSRAMVFDSAANIIAVAQEEFPQIYPDSGWVEHDPEAIWQTTLRTAQKAFKEAEAKGGEVVAIGITNQRETTIVWERESGKPIHNAIVWQDRRTAGICQRLAEDENLCEEIQQKTGLLLDPYFSATKIAWLLDNVEGARQKAEDGKLAFGTVDSFIISRLTGGRVHVTDATNASRTSIYNIREQGWDETLLGVFSVPASVLPEVLDCAADFGETEPEIFGRSIPILGVAGDQQAAAVGQCCFDVGSIKSTYGTGCFVLMNTGDKALLSKNRMLTTVGYQFAGETTYALEGSIFSAGSAVQWLRDGLKIISSAPETEQMAAELDGNKGVYMVPAFTGLGAPYWNPDARGAVLGIGRGTGPAEFVRAVLESVCYQTHDLFAAMADDGINPAALRVDGGMVANNWVVQFLADILGLSVDRPKVMETTALGAAYLAGLQAGVFGSLDELSSQWQLEKRFEPEMEASEREELLKGWHSAVQRVIADV